MPRSLIVLPTYNEAQNIAEILRRVRSEAPDADLLVVDDGSPDGTAAIAEGEGLALGQVEVLHRPGKAGLGSAYREGFRIGLQRGYDALVEMDSDLSHDPASLPAVLGGLWQGDGADLCIGSRYVPGGAIPDWPWLRRFVSRTGNRYARAVLGLEAQDVTAGFRAYRRRALEAIDLGAVRSEGYGFQVEMTYLVQQGGGRIVETPIVFRDRTRGKSKMSLRIVVEALLWVSWWGLRDRVLRRRQAIG